MEISFLGLNLVFCIMLPFGYFEIDRYKNFLDKACACGMWGKIPIPIQVIKTTAEDSDRNWNYTNRAFVRRPKKKYYNRITTYVYITEND